VLSKARLRARLEHAAGLHVSLELFSGVHFVRQILAMLLMPVKSSARGGDPSDANNVLGMAPHRRVSKDAIQQSNRDYAAAEAAALKSLFEERAHGSKISQERFGLEYEIGSQGMVWQYLNGHRPLNLSVALKFARGLGVPIARFSPRLAAELHAAGLDATGGHILSEPIGILRASQIPVVGTARAGEDAHYVEIDYPTGHGDGYVSYPTKRGNAYAIRVRGDSMRPRIKPGEYVIIEPDVPVHAGDEVIVRTKAGKCMVKVLHAERRGFIELLSLNDDHKPITIEVKDIEFMHHVAGIAKDVLYHHESRDAAAPLSTPTPRD
jgi:SOS-response transcriptional repressor LexA